MVDGEGGALKLMGAACLLCCGCRVWVAVLPAGGAEHEAGGDLRERRDEVREGEEQAQPNI